ncbi:hypothetical protein OG738_12770 [Amycolatopsis sp. NBC_01488]|uniref:hypothetical protein n=1 Tax=Amycolatopsis sp. NBC_01488 TaxID=2903563 RepID=UPI002E296AE7|nr:hypothetical protein [Amycolatopsis sp. NBC_01488]
MTRVAGFRTATADPDDLRRAVTASPGFARAHVDQQAAVLELVLQTGTTQPRSRLRSLTRLLARRR